MPPGTEHGHGCKKVDAGGQTQLEQYKVQGNPSPQETLVGLTEICRVPLASVQLQ